jgi:hypothetical protein
MYVYGTHACEIHACQRCTSIRYTPMRYTSLEGIRPKRKQRHTDQYEEDVEDSELPESQDGAIG